MPSVDGSILIDIILLLVLVLFTGYGAQRGFARSLGAILGFVAGALLAFFAIPLVTGWVGSSFWRVPAVLLVVALLISVGIGVGTAAAHAIRSGVTRRKPGGLDRFLGAVLSLITTAVVISMLAFGIGSLGIPFVSQAIVSSRVVGAINAITPPPLSALEAQVRSAVAERGIPRLLDSIGAGTPLPIPTDGETAAQQAAAQSVVKVTGNAIACGQNQTGTGFVVSKGRVVTNAHVVAGVTRPTIIAPAGGSWTGRVVYFDPVGDLAVIAVTGMNTPALTIGSTLGQGAKAVFDGYPLGGPFSSKPAAVEGVSTVRVPDIYGANPSPREVYSLAADVQQGNSGGPLLDSGGRVSGVIFAKSATTTTGFALTTATLTPVVKQAAGLSTTVASGSCITE